MNKKLREIARYIFEPENIINGIGILAAAILAYSGIVNQNIPQTLTAILTVLTALAISQIVAGYENSKSRKVIEKMEETLDKVSRSSNNPPLLLRTDLHSLPERAKNARDILIIGRTAVLVLRYTDFFKERLAQKANIRIAIINPDNNAVVESLAPLIETSKDGLLADLQGTKGLIHRIREQTQNPAQFQVRVFDYVPTLSLAIIDGHLPSGHIIVEMVPFQVAPASRPLLYISAKDHPTWFNYFRDVSNAIWTNSKEASDHFK